MTLGAPPPEVGRLTEHMAYLRGSLDKSASYSDKMVSILTGCNSKLTALEESMRPVQMKTLAFRKIRSNLEATFVAGDMVLNQLAILQQLTTKLNEPLKSDVDGFMKSLQALEDVELFFEERKAMAFAKKILTDIQELQQASLDNILKDFRTDLLQRSSPMDPMLLGAAVPKMERRPKRNPNTGELPPPPANKPAATTLPIPPFLPSSLVTFLHQLAIPMVKSKHATQCARVYRDARSACVTQQLKRMGVAVMTEEELLKLPDNILAGRVTKWAQNVRTTIFVIFVEERRLCDAVFAGLDPHRERVYAELSVEGVQQLMNFGEVMADCSHTPEKIIMLLDMFEIVSGVMPQMERTFAGNTCIPARESTWLVAKALGKSIQGILAGYETVLEREVHKPLVMDGGIHAMTSVSVNFLKTLLLDHDHILERALDATLPSATSGSTAAAAAAAASALASGSNVPTKDHTTGGREKQATVLVRKILTSLLSHLETKSKLYKDVAIQHIFMMNNLEYMTQAMKKSAGATILGSEWMEKNRRLMLQNLSAYQRNAWSKAVSLLAVEKGANDTSDLRKSAVKDRLKSFNSALDDIVQRQAQWRIPDPNLREAVLTAIGEPLLPAYSTFLKRYAPLLEAGTKNAQKYIRYTPEELRNHLTLLFNPTAATPLSS
eukprot:TRINITY_DN3830_c0_g1_i1.p1 TRINITY_DN3830_c0_g1~~TRINITY_DN3830_c0_g1_i1.p1  ORF type:complete len:664 (-),score=141.92 TRINITY_DN3830_c0_g1_i1:1766-3757(-)